MKIHNLLYLINAVRYNMLVDLKKNIQEKDHTEKNRLNFY